MNCILKFFTKFDSICEDAAEMIQQAWRSRVARQVCSLLRAVRAGLVVQAWYRGIRGRRYAHFVRETHAALTLQCRWRCTSAGIAVDLKRNGQARVDYDKHMLVSRLQGFYRGKVARRGIPARRVVYQHRQEKKRREAAAFVVQRPAMQWLAINYVQEVREENRERNALRCTKAGTIQRFWRVVVAIEKRRVLVDIKARAYLKTGLVIQRWYVLRGALWWGACYCGIWLYRLWGLVGPSPFFHAGKSISTFDAFFFLQPSVFRHLPLF